MLSTFDGTNANVIRDFLFSFNAHSRHRYYYVFDCRVLDAGVDLAAFDVILLFWSVYLLGSNLSPSVRESIRKARARKVLFLQDEYRDVRPFNHAMAELGINVMFTCVAERDHELFYPPSLIPTLESIYTVLPGYVPTYLDACPFESHRARRLDVSYRSRELPYYLGDLGREKRVIGERFPAIAQEHGLRADISCREQDRIYGGAWIDFLRASRCVLGSASGASVVDFTGEIRRRCDDFLVEHPRATYEETKARFFADVDWKVVIDTVSPRIFEAVALGCTLVHHEGGYGGLLVPDEHYIKVSRDYSNIAGVVDRIKDRAYCERMAERAHIDLIRSGRYTYRTFAARFDRLLAPHVPARIRLSSVSRGRFYLKNYLVHDQVILPSGNRFVALPRRPRPSVRQRLRMLRARLVGSRGWKALQSRRCTGLLLVAIESPANVAVKAGIAFETVRRDPSLRVVWREYWRHRRSIGTWTPYGLLNDLVKIDVVRQARRGCLSTPRPFEIRLDYDRGSGIVLLKSVPVRDGQVSSGRRTLDSAACADLPIALAEGKVNGIVWNHSAFGGLLLYVPTFRRCENVPVMVRIGAEGVYRFDTLTRLCQQAPNTVGLVVARLLDGSTPLPPCRRTG